MPRWYYEKKELKNTTSILSGLEPETEVRYRREGARFITDLGTFMKLSYTTKATGVVYFHRFYMFHTFQDFPRYPTACACIFLAGKVEETPKKCKDIVKSAHSILSDVHFAQFGEEKNAVEEVMILERILLQTIKFDLQVEHPYTFLVRFAKGLKGEQSRLEKMVQMAWTFVNDSLCTTLSLQWEPEIIAIALMYLAGKLSKFEVQDWNGRTKDHLRWWDVYVEDMSIDLLEDICHQVLDLYSPQNNAQTSIDSPSQLHLPNQFAPFIGTPQSLSAQSSPNIQIQGTGNPSTPGNPPPLHGGPPPPNNSGYGSNYSYPPPLQGIQIQGPYIPAQLISQQPNNKATGISGVPPPLPPPQIQQQGAMPYYPPPPLPPSYPPPS